jgi:redox-sensitive bicupin YhaK (pirin superfamily)
MALPADQEECEPAFHHFAANAIPQFALDGARVTVMAGMAFGATSPVPAKSPTVYLDLQLDAGGALSVPADYSERALYALDVGCTLDGVALPQHQMQVLATGSTPLLQAGQAARVILVGGEPVGPRFIVWNFVSSRKERLLQARDDWEAGRFPGIAGETEFIPFPQVRV